MINKLITWKFLLNRTSLNYRVPAYAHSNYVCHSQSSPLVVQSSFRVFWFDHCKCRSPACAIPSYLILFFTVLPFEIQGFYTFFQALYNFLLLTTPAHSVLIFTTTFNLENSRIFILFSSAFGFAMFFNLSWI